MRDWFVSSRGRKLTFQDMNHTCDMPPPAAISFPWSATAVTRVAMTAMICGQQVRAKSRRTNKWLSDR